MSVDNRHRWAARAWAAGVFAVAGEYKPHIVTVTADPEVLRKFKGIVGVGKIEGNVWTSYQPENALAVIAPWGVRKGAAGVG
jgi:hypothetical protein